MTSKNKLFLDSIILNLFKIITYYDGGAFLKGCDAGRLACSPHFHARYPSVCCLINPSIEGFVKIISRILPDYKKGDTKFLLPILPLAVAFKLLDNACVATDVPFRKMVLCEPV